MKQISVLLCFFIPFFAFSQNMGDVSGTVKDRNTQQALVGANVTLFGPDTLKTRTDESGNFKISAQVGRYQIVVSNLGYASNVLYNISVTSGNAQILSVELDPDSESLDEVVISSGRTARATDMITPLSTQKLTAEEIKLNPGGNFDVSKVIQALPGVAGGTSPNRNDIIVRGGGPAENVYYLDGIEIPVLNHFQTQGASGGATGILNVSFINDVQLTSSAFDSRYDNALASTFVIKQRNGNPDKFGGNIRLSGSEFATTFEGPLSKNTTFLASARRSYLQFLFQLLDLPIRPDYWDFQYKVNQRINDKTELNWIGLGAIDNFKLATPKNTDADNAYILRANPLINQWNYTVGVSLKRLIDDGFYTIALSRNAFFNGADRYEDNATAEGEKLFSLGSHEFENKLRLDVNKYLGGWKLSYGLGAQNVKYDATLFNTLQPEVRDDAGNVTQNKVTLSSENAIDFAKAGAYVHVSNYFFDKKLLLSGGIRSDINSFTSNGFNPLKTLSPRLSAALALDDQWNLTGSVGTYYKLPAYTSLGYINPQGVLENKDLDYINATHYTVGTEFIPRNAFRVTLEAFYKDYANYPVSKQSGISIANIGTDFSAVGNEAYTSTGKGRVYGMEAYVQQKLVNRLFYVVSGTLYKSEFSGADGVFKPSTWDYGYVLSSTLGYQFPNNWDLGIKYRIAGGQPYTPFDENASRLNYLTSGQGVYDYSQLNEEQLPFFQQFDIRVDKKFNFQRTSMAVFVDLQNAFLYKTPSLPKYTFERLEAGDGFVTTDGNPIRQDGSNAVPLILEQRSATVVPTIGFIFEF